jgi:GNAT superfamily N-acetyltransferase
MASDRASPDAVGIRPMAEGEENAVCSLVCRVFDEHVAPGYGEEGRRTFRDFAAHPDRLAARLRAGHVCLVADLEGRLVGAIEMRPPAHVSLLFVETAQHRRGIARRLLAAGLEALGGPAPEESTVNSSLGAVHAYERLGFRRVCGTVERDGISYAPMTRARPRR